MRKSSPKSHYRGMTRQLAEEIRRLATSGRYKQAEIARKYGITQGKVSAIANRRVWA